MKPADIWGMKVKKIIRRKRLLLQIIRSTKIGDVIEPSPGGVEVQHPYRNVSDALRFSSTSEIRKSLFCSIRRTTIIHIRFRTIF